METQRIPQSLDSNALHIEDLHLVPYDGSLHADAVWEALSQCTQDERMKTFGFKMDSKAVMCNFFDTRKQTNKDNTLNIVYPSEPIRGASGVAGRPIVGLWGTHGAGKSLDDPMFVGPVILMPPYRGKGLVYKAARLALPMMFEELDLRLVGWAARSDNSGSIRTARGLGFSPNGTTPASEKEEQEWKELHAEPHPGWVEYTMTQEVWVDTARVALDKRIKTRHKRRSPLNETAQSTEVGGPSVPS